MAKKEDIKLNLEQKQAVTHKEGPLLIVAGAGTGKTAVITERIGWLIKEQKLNPDQILALTFTEKAAEEMEVRVDKALPYGYVDLWISTFHAFCQKILNLHGLDIGLPQDFKLLTPTDAWLLVRENLDNFELDYYKPLGNPTKFIHALIQHFSRAKDELVYPQDYLAYAEKLQLDLDNAGFGGKAKGKTKAKSGEEKELLEQEMLRNKEIANAYHFYQKLLLDNNALDFGDLINYALKLFKERPNILAQYRQQFKYILVDEFQDTNYAQYELIKLLAAPNNNITVVGDDDQSIYKFRGASISNILEFKKDYPHAKEIYLTKNYRSQQNILDLSYNFIQLNNPNRLEVKLQTKGQKKLSKKLVAQNNNPGLIESYIGDTLEDEIAWTVNKIINIYNKEKDTNWSDFAILVRANEAAKAYQDTLKQAQVPNYFLASRGLYRQAVVKDLIAVLKLLDNYHESVALWRILNIPIFELSDNDLIKLSHFANRKQWSLYEALQKVGSMINYPTETVAKFSRIIELVRKHTTMAREKNVTEVVHSWLTESKYLQYLDKLDDYSKLEQYNYLNSFYKRVKAFENKSEEATVKNFIAELNYEIESGEQGSINFDANDGPDTVKIMTVHSSKGLEFKYVFIVNLVDQRFPTINRRDPIELPDDLVKEILPEGDVHLQEERRLFYVAMTRAKQGLFFTSAQDYGGARKKKPSRFLVETGYDKQDTNNKIQITKLDKKQQISKPKPQINYQELLPKYFSFSQLKAFETCPLQYFYQYILKVPVKGNHIFSYGKTMHATLQKFYELIKQRQASKQADLFGQTVSTKNSNKPLVSLDELLEFYKISWIDDWYTSKAHMEQRYKEGIKILKEYYDLIKGNISTPLALEKGFFIKVGDYTLRGIIDRIDEIEPGVVEIIDYKTGKPKTDDKLTTDDKEQLLIYQVAAEEVLKLKVKKLTFYYLDANRAVSFIGSDKDKTAVKAKALELIERIKQTNFSAISGHHCQYCNFTDICLFAE